MPPLALTPHCRRIIVTVLLYPEFDVRVVPFDFDMGDILRPKLAVSRVEVDVQGLAVSNLLLARTAFYHANIDVTHHLKIGNPLVRVDL